LARSSAFCGISAYGYSAALTDGPQAGGAVAQRSGEHHADRSRAAAQRRRAQHRIDRRARVVLARTDSERDAVTFHQQVAIGRRNVNMSLAQDFPVFGELGRQRPGTCQQLIEGRPELVREVQGDQHRSRQVAAQAGGELHERLDASRRRAHGNYVPISHRRLQVTIAAELVAHCRCSSAPRIPSARLARARTRD
jgi:hypothetical protein